MWFKIQSPPPQLSSKVTGCGYMTVVQFQAGIFLFTSVHTSPGAQPASSPVGTGALSLGVRWLKHEANSSPPSSCKIMNVWSSPIFMAWCFH